MIKFKLLAAAALPLASLMMAPTALAISSGDADGYSNGEAHGNQQAQSQGVRLDVMLGVEGKPLTLNFDGPIRLRHALEAVIAETGANVHWPSARLIDRSGNAQLQQRQQDVVEELAALHDYWVARGNDSRAATAATLHEQVAGWQLAYQPFRSIDLLAARQTLDANPLLHGGEYVLIVGERPVTATVLGALEATELTLVPGQSVRNYLQYVLAEQPQRLDYQRASATLIRHGGERREVPWAIHNAEAVELSGGDLLWVKPASQVFSGGVRGHVSSALGALSRNDSSDSFQHLEDELPSLLQHWIGTQQGLPVAALAEPQPRVAHWQQQDLTPGRNHYGGVGLMQTPTARMAPEGETVLMYADTDEYRRYTVSMQVLPWMQASAFYTRIPNRLYSQRPDFSGSNILTDKGFDVKFRLWQEREWLPEVSVGLSDFAGTGLFDGEFIVASKRFGAFDLSAGIGFGRHGSRDNVSNPLCEIADRFCTRPGGFSGTGSQLEFDRYFSGPAGIFGGVEYQTPWDPLRLMVEYDANDYSRDRAGVPIEPRTPWNFGVNYRVADWIDASVSYERGDTVMFNVVFRTNLNTLSQVRVDRPRVEPTTPELESVDEVDWNRVARRLSAHRTVAAPRFNMPDENTVRVQGHPWRYRDNNEAIDRSARILADELPASVTAYEFETLTAFQPMAVTRVDTDAFVRRIRNEDAGKGIDETTELFERSSPAFDYQPERVLYDYPRSRRIGFGLNPFFNQDFGSPETFHFYQLGVKAFGSGWVANDLHLFGELGVNLKNNYDRFKFERDPFDFELPAVRSNFRLHATNDVWLDRLQLTYFKRLSENLYGMAYGGYLERAFSGVGGELLYRQVDSPWAFGLNINRVRQRDFNGWLGFEPYETTMGHASVYYQMPWLKDSLLRLDVGRFLAGDDGVGITFARRFESGVTVLAYASFTDVSSAEYGEGSFTHGFSVSIPFDLIGIRPSRQRVGMSWSPMSRDGGQPLWRHFELHGVTDERNPFWSR